MKYRGKPVWIITTKLHLPAVFAASFFFLAGLFCSNLLPQHDVYGGKRILLESIDEFTTLNILPNGETGEHFITTVPFQVLSWKPRALYFPNFASAEQCQKIIEMARPMIAPSTVSLRKGETEESTKGVRTSSGVFISASEDKTGILEHIEAKIAKVTMIGTANGEAFNVLRYKVGQKYNSHFDVFNPEEYGPQKGQRVASFLLYLSDVGEGGETMFPFENGVKYDYDFEECIGLKVKPQRGDGLLFYSLLPNGTIDQTSLHGSCPVIRGEKWVATKWIRDRVYEG